MGKMVDLSIIIPARNEMFLKRTIEDILSNIEGNTEIIAVLDGEWANPPIPDNERVTLIHHPVSIGQRAATNEAARLSQAKYVMKCDGHCAFDKGFDVKMMKEMHDDYTMVPRLYNLHAFDWKCKKCGNQTYQGPTPTKCDKCDNTTDFEMVIFWQPRLSRKTDFMRFDKDLKFQYWGDYGNRPEVIAQGDIVDTMSLLGACWMLTRDKYKKLNICDERHGSWGQQGTEVACKTWLSGGRLVVNKKTWYSHMFRTQGGDFGFPYHLSGHDVDKAREYSRHLFLDNMWPDAIHPFSWLIEKFAPVPTWDLKQFKPLTKGVIYYTDNDLKPEITEKCQKQLKKAFNGKIVSVSLKPIDFGENITLPLVRGYLTMFKQILAGLEALDTDIVFFCEHDVLYSPTHFEFTPPTHILYYYNQNVWQVRYQDGHGLYYDCKKTNGLCAYRDMLITHYRERVRKVEKEGYNYHMGFEPGTKGINSGGFDNLKSGAWRSNQPNVDIRHSNNLTRNRWTKDLFHSQKNCRNWLEQDNIPGWGHFSHFWKKI
jgi:glycosyltransferase involved in cell wall biosynthesis